MTTGRRTRGVTVPVTLGLLSKVLAGCTPRSPVTFDTPGPVSRSRTSLFFVPFWAGVFVFVAVAGALVFAVGRYRRRANHGAPEQVGGQAKLRIAWTMVPRLVLTGIAVPTVLITCDNANSPLPVADGGLQVKVIGHQWWFEFEYPEYDVTTANELHIPVGEPINFTLQSADVLHSFWVPELFDKGYLVPNEARMMLFEVSEPGEHVGQCNDFCGVSHTNMRFKVVTQTTGEFAAWVAAQQAPAADPEDPLAQAGKEIFFSTKAGCHGCHTIDGTSAMGRIGPDLTHFASRDEFVWIVLEDAQQNLRAWLEDPEKMKPGNRMARDAAVYNDPNRALTEPEISALIAYLRALR